MLYQVIPWGNTLQDLVLSKHPSIHKLLSDSSRLLYHPLSCESMSIHFIVNPAGSAAIDDIQIHIDVTYDVRSVRVLKIVDIRGRERRSFQIASRLVIASVA